MIAPGEGATNAKRGRYGCFCVGFRGIGDEEAAAGVGLGAGGALAETGGVGAGTGACGVRCGTGDVGGGNSGDEGGNG